MIKVVIAEDHPITIAGTKHALRKDPDIQVVGEAVDGCQLRALLAKGPAPDILLLDTRMPDFEILEELPQFKEQHPKMKIVIVTVFDDKQTVGAMLALGVNGYVVKNEEMDVYPRAIHDVYRGGMYLSPSIAEYAVRPEPRPVELSDRQQEILILMARDLTTHQIAKELALSESTVNT